MVDNVRTTCGICADIKELGVKIGKLLIGAAYEACEASGDVLQLFMDDKCFNGIERPLRLFLDIRGATCFQ